MGASTRGRPYGNAVPHLSTWRLEKVRTPIAILDENPHTTISPYRPQPLERERVGRAGA